MIEVGHSSKKLNSTHNRHTYKKVTYGIDFPKIKQYHLKYKPEIYTVYSSDSKCLDLIFTNSII